MSDSLARTDTLLTYQQAAEVLGTAPTFVERLVSDRRIAFVKLGHLVRIRRSDLDSYLEKARIPAAADD